MLEVVVHTQGARRAVQAQRTAGPRLMPAANVGRASGLHGIEMWTTPFQPGGSFPVASTILEGQGGGPIMSPVLSESSGLPWAIRPVVSAAPALANVRDSYLGTRAGGGGGCGCHSAAPAETAGLESLPWWLYVAGGLAIAGLAR